MGRVAALAAALNRRPRASGYVNCCSWFALSSALGEHVEPSRQEQTSSSARPHARTQQARHVSITYPRTIIIAVLLR